MSESRIFGVKQPVTSLPRGTDRDQRMSRTIQARRRLNSPRGGGRAWINGREVGGTDPRWDHLSAGHD